MMMSFTTRAASIVGSLLFVHLLVAAVGVRAVPQPLIVAVDDASGDYIVNPPGNSAAWNEFPYGQPVCRSNVSGYRTATGDSNLRVLLASAYGLRISCLSVAAAELRTAGPSCPSSPSVDVSLSVYDATGTLKILDDVPIEQIFNGSIQEIFISHHQVVEVFLTVTIANPSCPVDIVVAADMLAVNAPLPSSSSSGPSDLPILTGIIQPSALLRKVVTPSSPSNTSLRLQRLALSPAYNTSDPIRVVLVPTSVPCASTNVTNPTPSFGFGDAQRLGSSNVNLVVTLPIPSIDGTYSLCTGRLRSSSSNTTSSSALVSIGTLFIFSGNPAYLKLPPGELTVGSPVTGVFVGSGLNATVDLAMATLWAHDCSEGNVATDVLIGPLENTGANTVQWTVTFLQVNVYRFCYQLRGSGGWQDVPSYWSLDLHSIANLEPASYSAPPNPSPASGSVPPTTSSSSPVPSTPVPTIASGPGTGCSTASAAEIMLFGRANMVRLQLLGFRVGLVAYLSAHLCVEQSDIVMYVLWQEGTSATQFVMITSRAGRYLGTERMAYLVYEFFPANADFLLSNYKVASMTPTLVTGGIVLKSPSSSSSGGAVAQLVVGVIVAGIVGFVLCTCGLMFLCCRRYTDRRISEARRRVAAEGVTVVVNHRGVQSQLVIARVTGGTGSDDDDSSSRHSNSDSEMSSVSAVDGTVVGDANGLFPPPRGTAGGSALPDAAEVYGYRTEQLGYLPSPAAAAEPNAATTNNTGSPPPASPAGAADAHRPSRTQQNCDDAGQQSGAVQKSTSTAVVEFSPFQVEDEEIE